jgi:exopolyphosphatase / guanosine-5'-triphosphate,3'-diphosphate pyrophosphatase
MEEQRTADSPATPQGVVPRWEWRTFGASIDFDRTAFEPAGDEVHESDEVYLLPGGVPGGNGDRAPDSVKVRDGLIDIKRLHEVDARGLERWSPIMKAPFPLPATEVAKVLTALGVDPPSLEREAYTLEQLIDELITPTAGVSAVKVHKRRRRFTIDGNMAEISEVTADGRPTGTVAVEGTDTDALIGAVQRSGLGRFVNVSYPRGLRALLGSELPRYAVIDVGTNSVKFHIGERQADGSFRRVVDRAVLTRLGEGLTAEGGIGDEPVERTATAIAGMAAEARRAGALEIAAVGTAGLRIARNSADVLARIARQTGVVVEVISGEDEARLAYQAAVAAAGARTGRVVVFDTGGGSSQFTFGQDGRIEERFSVNVGAVSMTERFGLDQAVPADALVAALEGIGTELSALDDRERPAALIGMGGAITNLSAVSLSLAAYDPDAIQGLVLDRAEIDRQVEQYRSLDADGRRSIVGLQPKRAEVMLAGALIVRTVMEKLGAEALVVSDRGLRHGVLLERFGTQGGTPPMATKPNPRPRRATKPRPKAAPETKEIAVKADESAASDGAAQTAEPAPAKTAPAKSAPPAKRTPAAAAPAAAGVDTAPRLSDADLRSVLELINSGVDSVELKLTVPTQAHRATISGLPVDPIEAQPRQVFFFDTPDLALNKAGVIVRARRIQGGKGDTVIKLRPVVPAELPADLRASASFKTEVDVVPGGFVCSGSFKGKSTAADIRNAIHGEKPLSKLFSKGQRAFFAEHAPDGIDLDSLTTLGPTYTLKGTFEPKELGRRVTVEMWLYPDGSRILELSTKAAPAEAFQVSAEARAYLTGTGIDLGGAQEPKTRAALEFFAQELEGA